MHFVAVFLIRKILERKKKITTTTTTKTQIPWRLFEKKGYPAKHKKNHFYFIAREIYMNKKNRFY